MEPINPTSTMVPFTSPQHGFTLIAGGILQPISSLAYVDDAKHYIVVPKQTHTHMWRVFQYSSGILPSPCQSVIGN